MPSPPSASSLGVHPPSPILIPNETAQRGPVSDGHSSTDTNPSHSSFQCSSLELSSLPSSSLSLECSHDKIAAWRETTPLARLLALHGRGAYTGEHSAQLVGALTTTAAIPAREPTQRADIARGPTVERQRRNGRRQENQGDEGKGAAASNGETARR